MARFSTRFLPILLVLFCAAELSAQNSDRSTALERIGGRHYLVALPDTVTNERDVRFPIRTSEHFELMIYSETSQTLRLRSRPGLSESLSIGAGEILRVDLADLEIPMTTERNEVSAKVLDIRSDDPILLYAYMTTRFGTAGYTPLPVEAWGRNYVVAARGSNLVRHIRQGGETDYDARTMREAPAQIVIVAAEENTQVSISPAKALADCDGCTSVVLGAGEAYMVESHVDVEALAENSYDISGSQITANKPIGLLVSNSRTQVDELPYPVLAGNSHKDLTAEWVRPTDLHGYQFVHLPIVDGLQAFGRFIGQRDPVRENEYVRIYATDYEGDERSVGGEVFGAGDESEQIDGGERIRISDFFDLDFSYHRPGSPSARYFRIDGAGQAFQHPQGVGNFRGTTGSGNFIGANYEMWGTAAVEMMPRNRWASFAPIRTPEYPLMMRHYLNVVASTRDRDRIYLTTPTGREPVAFERGEIPGTDLVWDVIPLTGNTSYLLEGENGASFSGYVCGLDGGYELYRPGRIESDDKDASSSSAHPAEYEELLGAAYAWPLPARHDADISSVVSTGTRSGSLALHSAVIDADGTATFELEGVGDGARSGVLTLYDAGGRQLLSRPIPSLEPGRSTVALELGRMPSGLYIVDLSVGTERATLPVSLVR